MTLRRDAFPASPVNARLSWALRLALLLQCSPVSSFVWRHPKKAGKVALWHDYFTGFVADNADRVVESLYLT
jgi:hypothetical protein